MLRPLASLPRTSRVAFAALAPRATSAIALGAPSIIAQQALVVTPARFFSGGCSHFISHHSTFMYAYIHQRIIFLSFALLHFTTLSLSLSLSLSPAYTFLTEPFASSCKQISLSLTSSSPVHTHSQKRRQGKDQSARCRRGSKLSGCGDA